MAFTHDRDTSAGLLRTLVDDVDSTSYVFEDADLTTILDQNSDDIWNSAADCCRALAAKYAKEAFVLGLGKRDIYLDRTKKAAYYTKLAQMYDSRSGSDVVEYIDSFNIHYDGTGGDDTEYIGVD